MSFNTTIKSKTRGPLLFPGVSPDGDSAITSYGRLVQTLKSLNPAVSVNAVMDILYESIFGLTAYELRAHLDLPGNVKLRQALKQRSPAGYRYLCFAEEVLIADLEQNRYVGRMSLKNIMERVVALSPAFSTQSRNLIQEHLDIDIATGKRIVLTDPDNPF